MLPCGERETEWCVRVRVRGWSGCVLWDAVRRKTSGTMPDNFECVWKLLPGCSAAGVFACVQVSPSIEHCLRVVIVCMWAFMIRSCMSGGTVSSGEQGTIVVERGRKRLFQRDCCNLPYISSLASSIVDLSAKRTSPVGDMV
jgi:hypothetical protein